jgi:hypothetical protein
VRQEKISCEGGKSPPVLLRPAAVVLFAGGGSQRQLSSIKVGHYPHKPRWLALASTASPLPPSALFIVFFFGSCVQCLLANGKWYLYNCLDFFSKKTHLDRY